MLLAAAAAAMVWTNGFGDSYRAFWGTEIHIGAGSAWEYRQPLIDFVNEALMALFFFVVGLEIKRDRTNPTSPTGSSGSLKRAVFGRDVPNLC